jgi:hypothetical protein
MRFFTVLLFIALACCCARGVHAQEFDASLLEDANFSQTYLLEFAGTVLHENFTSGKAILTFSKAPPGSQHEYLVLIEGFPQKQTRNSFYWNSEDSTMEVYANHVVCAVRQGAIKTADIHFFYLSPSLLKRPYTHKDKENLQKTLKTAKPTKVFAQSGELKLTINAQTVAGTVWLKGYDSIQKSHVQYAVSFSGTRESRVEQTEQMKKK